jgi:hypothetical protein
VGYPELEAYLRDAHSKGLDIRDFAAQTLATKYGVPQREIGPLRTKILENGAGAKPESPIVAAVVPSPAPVAAAPSATTPFCPHCGKAIESGMAFCPNCGNKVVPPATPQVSAAQPAGPAVVPPPAPAAQVPPPSTDHKDNEVFGVVSEDASIVVLLGIYHPTKAGEVPAIVEDLTARMEKFVVDAQKKSEEKPSKGKRGRRQEKEEKKEEPTEAATEEKGPSRLARLRGRLPSIRNRSDPPQVQVTTWFPQKKDGNET